MPSLIVQRIMPNFSPFVKNGDTWLCYLILLCVTMANLMLEVGDGFGLKTDLI